MMDFDKNVLSAIAASSVEQGSVYVVQMDESNGITTKDGERFRNKYFVVLGFDNLNQYCGGLVINSLINSNIPQIQKYLHLPIKQQDNPFLSYNSFVNCTRLKEVSLDKFSTWKLCGKLDANDLELAIRTLKESPLEQPAHLAMFNIE